MYKQRIQVYSGKEAYENMCVFRKVQRKLLPWSVMPSPWPQLSGLSQTHTILSLSQIWTRFDWSVVKHPV